MFVWRRMDGSRPSSLDNDNAWWPAPPQGLWVDGFDLREIGFRADGRYLVVGSEDATARVYQWPEGTLSMVLRGHRGAVTAAEFSREGPFIVTGSLDGTVRVWRNRPPVATLAERPEVHSCVGTNQEPKPDREVELAAEALLHSKP